MRISFGKKLTLSYILVILVSFTSTAFFLDRNLEKNSLQNIQSSLITQSKLIAGQIPLQRFKQLDTSYLENLIRSLSSQAKCRITLIDTSGKVVADSDRNEAEIPSMENHLYRPEVKAALSSGIGTDTRYSATLKMSMLYVASLLKDDSGQAGILRLSLPLESVQKTLLTIRKTIFVGFLFALVIALVFGAIMAGYTIRPVLRMIQASRKFSEGDFSRKIIRAPDDEIGELAVTLNKMAADIENKITEIQSQGQKLSAVFNSMIEGIIIVDNSSRIISVNPAAERIFSVSKEACLGKVFLEAIPNSGIFEIINSVLAGGKPETAEISLVLPAKRIFQVNALPISEGKVNACLVVIHNVTEMRRLETVRSDFVANVSHELKTPLTSIKGFVETLLEGAIDDKENNRNFLKIIQDHAGRLDSLVNDLLALSHLESKHSALKVGDYDFKEQVDKVISGVSAQSKKKSVILKNDLAPGFALRADKNRIEQVLTNLIDNAIKFNKENGSVRVYAEEIDNKAKIVIEDTGIGIPEKDIPRIFERFYRVDKARSRELGGTGLGLSIVRHIIELHNGSIGVESTEGLGSKFWFVLPK